MGVISTPPMPAAAIFSSWAVSDALSTALPGHHQRVHGLFSRVISGQPRGEAAESAAFAETTAAKAATTISERGVRMVVKGKWREAPCAANRGGSDSARRLE